MSKVEFAERLERMFEQHRERRAGLDAMTTRISSLSATATSPRREVEITVGRGGAVSEVRFPTSAYKRMTPRELADTVMATINEAQRDIQEQTAAILTPMMPAGVDVKGLLSGQVGPDVLVGEEPLIPPSVREQLGLGRSSR